MSDGSPEGAVSDTVPAGLPGPGPVGDGSTPVTHGDPEWEPTREDFQTCLRTLAWVDRHLRIEPKVGTPGRRARGKLRAVQQLVVDARATWWRS